MGKKDSKKQRLQSIVDRLSEPMDDLAELTEELQNWVNGLSGTNLENSAKYDNLVGAIEILEDTHEQLERLTGDVMYSLDEV